MLPGWCWSCSPEFAVGVPSLQGWLHQSRHCLPAWSQYPGAETGICCLLTLTLETAKSQVFQAAPELTGEGWSRAPHWSCPVRKEGRGEAFGHLPFPLGLLGIYVAPRRVGSGWCPSAGTTAAPGAVSPTRTHGFLMCTKRGFRVPEGLHHPWLLLAVVTQGWWLSPVSSPWQQWG